MHDFSPPLFCRVRFPVSFLLLSFTAVLRRQKTSLRKKRERISPQNEGGEEIAEIGADTLAVKMKLRRMSSSSSRKVYPFSSRKRGRLFGRIYVFFFGRRRPVMGSGGGAGWGMGGHWFLSLSLSPPPRLSSFCPAAAGKGKRRGEEEGRLKNLIWKKGSVRSRRPP